MRRQSREIALQILFQTEFAPQITFEDLFSIYTEEHPEQKDRGIIKYADDIVRGVQSHKVNVDQKIQDASRHWKIERMGGVDRNILRMSVFEMLFSSEMIEPKIAINEAIEVAKVFGSQESPSFVNGILDQVVKNERR